MSADAAESDAEHSDFPNVPRKFTDKKGRVIRFLSTGDSPTESASDSPTESASDSSLDERDSLAAMYDTFGPADRAQGIPPANPRRRDDWLDRLLEGIEVLGWHREEAVAHGVLLDGGPGHELALFVHPDYRGTRIGSALLRTLLGRGRSASVERVWLSVERTNRSAVRLYREAGFETVSAHGGGITTVMEMRLSL